jgi:hypothetical protein
MTDQRKECCRVKENLEPQDSSRPELTIVKCKVCGCRHFELTIETVEVGVTGQGL